MQYRITTYTKNKAKQLGVVVKTSTNPKKKIDVYKDNKKIASVGAVGYKDYPTYIKENGLEYANERRRLYRIRHKTDKNIVGSNGYYANELLW
jgi:hypothetical protein